MYLVKLPDWRADHMRGPKPLYGYTDGIVRIAPGWDDCWKVFYTHQPRRFNHFRLTDLELVGVLT